MPGCNSPESLQVVGQMPWQCIFDSDAVFAVGGNNDAEVGDYLCHTFYLFSRHIELVEM
jgi:hypothetical protein